MSPSIIIGYGEIGQAIHEVFSYYLSISICDVKHYPEAEAFDAEFMFVAIPYNENFIRDIKHYKRKHNPVETIIFSTVPVGTCNELGASHSPIEGKHPNLEESLRVGVRWIGGRCPRFLKLCHKVFSDVIEIESSEHTEFMKLRSTALYALNIEFARYSKKVADKLGLKYILVKEWDITYNALYSALGEDRFRRYILDPPEGKIGGHCLLPNAEMLQKQFPSIFLSEILKENE